MFFDPKQQRQWEHQRDALHAALDEPYGTERLQKVHQCVKAILKLQQQLFSEHKKYYKAQGLTSVHGARKVRFLTDRFLMKKSTDFYSTKKENSVIKEALIDWVHHKDLALLEAVSVCLDVTHRLSDGMYAMEHLMSIKEEHWSFPIDSVYKAQCMHRLWQQVQSEHKISHSKALAERFMLYAVTMGLSDAQQFWFKQNVPLERKLKVVLGAKSLDVTKIQIQEDAKPDALWDVSEPSMGGAKQQYKYGGRYASGGNWTVPMWHYALSVGVCEPLHQVTQNAHDQQSIDVHQVLLHLLEFTNKASDIDRFCQTVHRVDWFESDEARLLEQLAQRAYGGYEHQKELVKVQQVLAAHRARWQKEYLEGQVQTLPQSGNISAPVRRL